MNCKEAVDGQAVRIDADGHVIGIHWYSTTQRLVVPPSSHSVSERLQRSCPRDMPRHEASDDRCWSSSECRDTHQTERHTPARHSYIYERGPGRSSLGRRNGCSRSTLPFPQNFQSFLASRKSLEGLLYSASRYSRKNATALFAPSIAFALGHKFIPCPLCS